MIYYILNYHDIIEIKNQTLNQVFVDSWISWKYNMI
jgi:hypothetical protein